MAARRIALRLEGWYYIAVLSFVLGGAVLRDVNLLLMLAGLMAGPLLAHLFMIRSSLSGLTVERNVPPRVCVGEIMEISVTLKNRRKRGSAWGVEWHDEFHYQGSAATDAKTGWMLHFPHVKAGESVIRRFYVSATRRGEYRFHNASLHCRFPLGLCEGTITLTADDRFFVCPAIGKTTSDWERLIHSDQEGQLESQHRRGSMEGEFYALREWRNGDSRRWIHWRTSAKMGTLAVRQFERRRSSRVVIMLDLHLSTQTNERERRLLEEAISFAATAAIDAGKKGGGRFALLAYGRETLERSAAASALFARELLDCLSEVRGTHAPDLTHAATILREEAAMGAKCVVLSTRARESVSLGDVPDSLMWLNGSADEFGRYFTPPERLA